MAKLVENGLLRSQFSYSFSFRSLKLDLVNRSHRNGFSFVESSFDTSSAKILKLSEDRKNKILKLVLKILTKNSFDKMLKDCT